MESWIYTLSANSCLYFRLDTLSTDASEIDAQFAQIEKDVDALRTALYAPFKPEVQFLDSLTIQDTIDGVQILSSAGAKTAADANLPPMGQLTRPPVKNGQRVISMRGKDILGVWDKSTIYEISQAPTDANTPYKVKFDPVVYQGRQKQAFIKKLSLKNIAYFDPAPVRLQVGTRIIGKYNNLNIATYLIYSNRITYMYFFYFSNLC